MGVVPVEIDDDLDLTSLGGTDEQIGYLQKSVIFPLKHPKAFTKWGVPPPKGILFHGPPGTGKTILAKALACEMKKSGIPVTFYYHRGSESNTMWFGETERKLRELFAAAQETSPSIIFFDEIDALCPDRTKAQESSEAFVSIVTCMLGLIDSVKKGKILVIGATNLLHTLDPAIRRTGRFDKDLEFFLPDQLAREKIIDIHTKKWANFHPTTELRKSIATRANGLTGADLELLCKKARSSALIRLPVGDSVTNLTVEPADWEVALKEVMCMASRIPKYRSTLYVAKEPPATFRPLYAKTLESISRRLDTEISTMEGDKKVQMIGVRALAISEVTPEHGPFLHDHIMNYVLGSEKVSRFPVYCLDYMSALRMVHHGSSTWGSVMGDIIRQASESKNPCILYCPNLNFSNRIVRQMTNDKNFEATTLIEGLRSLAGSQALVLATFVGPTSEDGKSLSKLQSLLAGFQTLLKIDEPDAEERLNFFRQVFHDLVADEGPTSEKKAKVDPSSNPEASSSSPTLNRHLGNAVHLSREDSILDVMRLYHSLQQDKKNHATHDENGNVTGFNLQELDKAFSHTLDMYDVNKLIQ